MKLRVGKELTLLLKQAREWCDNGAGMVLRKARRKAARLQPDLAEISLESTYGGTVITVQELPEESGDDIRRLLLWYLRNAAMRPPHKFTSDLREGVDYIIVNAE